MRMKLHSPGQPEASALNRLLACASSKVSPSDNFDNHVTFHRQHSNPLHDDSMHVFCPKYESDPSILSSTAISEGNLSSFDFEGLYSDSFVPPFDASTDSLLMGQDDLLENDPYLEPLSSLQDRLKSKDKTSTHSAKAVNKDSVTDLSLPRTGIESLKFPLPVISIPNIVSLADEKATEDDDDCSSHILDESFIIPGPIVNDSQLGSKCDTARNEDRILHLKKVIQQELQRKVLSHVQTVGGCSSQRSPEIPKSSFIANLYMELGTLEQQQHSYSAAIDAFFHAATSYRNEKDETLDLASALDAAVVAYCLAIQGDCSINWKHHPHYKVSRFFHCMNDVVRIRKQELGPNHVDTLEAIHHLAQLCVLTGEPDRALPHYIEVIQLYASVFGPHHPNLVVMAHGLGNAYLQCQDVASAQEWYQYASRIHAAMKSPATSVRSLWGATARLERIHRWTQEDPAQDENLLFEL